ncbi:S26 family signal peptidase [Clostridium folliculivorans]|uniref:Signal peptidase I n=1 Tax=Clostridium folliculivorans TaxID=2886038 RepID=A0A9W5Y617_9CLOT|nr:signal peptidase I [Clostridium folliculivorans]GKU27200.1 S26 family signal peptidase [Clostridium folliculivorans]
MVKNILKWIKNISFAIIVTILIICIVLNIKGSGKRNYIPSIGPYKIMTVLSGSMSPTFNAGDVIIGKSTDIKDLRSGDIITFKYNDSLTTHRILSISNEDKNLVFQTKGDYNNVKDLELVKGQDIVSKYLFRVPLIGFVIVYMKRTIGIIVIWLLILLVVINEVYSRYRKKDFNNN